MREFRWRLVTYPSGVKQIEWLTDAEADVKAKATNKPIESVIVLTKEEYDKLCNQSK